MDWDALVKVGGWLMAALLGAGGLYFNWRQQKARDRQAPAESRKLESEANRNDAEALQAIGQAWNTLLSPMQTQINALKEQNAGQAAEMTQMRAGSLERDTKLADQAAKIAALEEHNAQLDTKAKQLDEELATVKAAFDAVNKLMASWRIGIRQLLAQIVGFGETPVWTPDDDTHKGA
jgi:chromosome segregation ATPase